MRFDEDLHQSTENNPVLELLTLPNQIQWILVGLKLLGQSRCVIIAFPYATSVAYAEAKIITSHFKRAAVHQIGECLGEIFVDFRARVGRLGGLVRERDEVNANDRRGRCGAACQHKR